jgi:uncharacterized protein (TIGR03435 family)
LGGVRVSEAGGVAYRTLAGHLSGINNRQIIDKTGLTGIYDVHLRWERDGVATAVDASQQSLAEPHAPSLFDAMEKQLGLRRESGTGRVSRGEIRSKSRPRIDCSPSEYNFIRLSWINTRVTA